jgi:hypothetical protein
MAGRPCLGHGGAPVAIVPSGERVLSCAHDGTFAGPTAYEAFQVGGD